MALGSPAVPALSGTGPHVIIAPAEGPHLAATLPIYDAVESDWFRARGREMTGPGDLWAGRPASELRSWRVTGGRGLAGRSGDRHPTGGRDDLSRVAATAPPGESGTWFR
jgi:hypothetical protein